MEPLACDGDGGSGSGSGTIGAKVGLGHGLGAAPKISISSLTHSELVNPEFMSLDMLRELITERGYKNKNHSKSSLLDHTKDELLSIYRETILPKSQRIYSTTKRFERKLAQNQLNKHRNRQHESKTSAALTVLNHQHQQVIQINGLKRPLPPHDKSITPVDDHDIPMKKTKNEIKWP